MTGLLTAAAFLAACSGGRQTSPTSEALPTTPPALGQPVSSSGASASSAAQRRPTALVTTSSEIPNPRFSRPNASSARIGGSTPADSAASSVAPHRSHTPVSARPTSQASMGKAGPSISQQVSVPCCHTSQLTFSVGQGNGAAGHIATPLRLTNTSGQECFVRGYIGLHLVDGQRRFLKTNLTRQPGATPLVRLRPTMSAVATLLTRNLSKSGTQGSCIQSTFLEVTPPNETDYLFRKEVLSTCDAEVDVSPLGSLK